MAVFQAKDKTWHVGNDMIAGNLAARGVSFSKAVPAAGGGGMAGAGFVLQPELGKDYGCTVPLAINVWYLAYRI